MPVNAFAQQGLTQAGWRVVQVWDEYLDPAATRASGCTSGSRQPSGTRRRHGS